MKLESDEKSSWVVLRSYKNEPEAYIDKGVLETNGITCVINNGVSAYPMTDTWAPVQLLVPRAELGKAKECLGL